MYKVVAILFLAVIFLTACSSDSALIRGKEATVTEDTFVASDVDSYKELKDAISNDNRQGVASLMAEGKADTIDSGTVVTVVDPVISYQLVKVRLLDGTEVIVKEGSLKQ